ncbi:MAG: invasion associated locus B family protein [Alphaproteobacteria bacterium]|nr:MAG: invasion associated locus B family protein [Alphaproteobacteria bacterium]
MILRVMAPPLALLAATSMSGAQPTAKPEKFSPRPVQPAPSPSASAPQSEIAYSPWTKFCGSEGTGAQAREICLTVKQARLSTGQLVAAAALIERTGEHEKLLRVTLPPDFRLSAGARMFIDSGAPRDGNFVQCLANGCLAEFNIAASFVAKLKSGQNLHLQGTNLAGAIESYLLPLADFAVAHEGAPTAPKTFEMEPKKLQEELQLRIERERRRL